MYIWIGFFDTWDIYQLPVFGIRSTYVRIWFGFDSIWDTCTKLFLSLSTRHATLMSNGKKKHFTPLTRGIPGRHRDHTLAMNCVRGAEDRIQMLDAAIARILWQKVSILCLLLSTNAQKELFFFERDAQKELLLGFCLFFLTPGVVFLVIQAHSVHGISSAPVHHLSVWLFACTSIPWLFVCVV